MGRAMPRVECRTPDGFAKDIPLAEGVEVSVGRAPENTLTEGGQALSRKHAVIHYIDGLPILKDLNSSNGTFLNGEEVHRPQVLSHGDVVTCGELSLTFIGD